MVWYAFLSLFQTSHTTLSLFGKYDLTISNCPCVKLSTVFIFTVVLLTGSMLLCVTFHLYMSFYLADFIRILLYPRLGGIRNICHLPLVHIHCLYTPSLICNADLPVSFLLFTAYYFLSINLLPSTYCYMHRWYCSTLAMALKACFMALTGDTTSAFLLSPSMAKNSCSWQVLQYQLQA